MVLSFKGIPRKKGGTLTAEHKKKISAKLKAAHAEGRGWHIGKARNQRKPSYPEQFFAKVIENEFTDKAYVTELRVSKYSINFAWPHLKKAIEIDGQFHSLPEYAARDRRKDAYLKNEGWSLMRVPWKGMYADPRKGIDLAIEFLGCAPVV